MAGTVTWFPSSTPLALQSLQVEPFLAPPRHAVQKHLIPRKPVQSTSFNLTLDIPICGTAYQLSTASERRDTVPTSPISLSADSTPKIPPARPAVLTRKPVPRRAREGEEVLQARVIMGVFRRKMDHVSQQYLENRSPARVFNKLRKAPPKNHSAVQSMYHPTIHLPDVNVQNGSFERISAQELPQLSPVEELSEWSVEHHQDQVYAAPVIDHKPDSTVVENRSCVACSEDFPVSTFSAMTATCDHSASTCPDCISQWIEMQLNDQSWDKITCAECSEDLQHTDMKRLANDAMFARYDRLAARSVLNNIPDFRWCTNEGCESGQVHENAESSPIFRCHECNYRYCIAHEMAWHDGETCKAFDRRMNEQSPEEERQVLDEKTRIELEAVDGRSNRSFPNSTTDNWLARPFLERLICRTQSRWNPGNPVASAFTNALAATQVTGADRSSADEFLADESLAIALQEEFKLEERKRSDEILQVERQRYTRERNLREKMARDQEIARLLAQEQERKEGERRKKEQREAQRREANRREAARREAARREAERQAAEERRAYQERQKRKEEERMGEETVRSVSKACPQCTWNIQKTVGCDHMTCSRCGYEFCWLCFADYTPILAPGGNNRMHETTCKYYG